MVTCGDLGTHATELEKKLHTIFQRAINWKAILLLDEADVFLQERDLHNLERNALVSVFLRHIEYYDGLLFLTTNRPGQLDEAFRSRIHITLGLPDMDDNRQKKVWLIFIKMLKLGNDKATDRTNKLALLGYIENDLVPTLQKERQPMNGRQIRNCIRAAMAIATKKRETLGKSHIEEVVNLGNKFQTYMNNVHRMDQEAKARALGHRFSEP